MARAKFNVAACTGCGIEFHPPIFGTTSDVCEECRKAVPQKLQAPAVSLEAAPARRVNLTTVLVALNVMVFALMVLGGVSPVQPSVRELLRWGGDYGPATFNHQWWRMITSAFVHAGILHLGLNMWVFSGLGRVAERLFGSWRMLALYLLSGIGSSLASLWWHPLAVSVGASGAIFGVAGGLFVAMKLRHVALPEQYLRRNIGSLGAFLIYNLLFGAAIAHVDNAAHVGGLLTGACIGALLPVKYLSESSQ